MSEEEKCEKCGAIETLIGKQCQLASLRGFLGSIRMAGGGLVFSGILTDNRWTTALGAGFYATLSLIRMLVEHKLTKNEQVLDKLKKEHEPNMGDFFKAMTGKMVRLEKKPEEPKGPN